MVVAAVPVTLKIALLPLATSANPPAEREKEESKKAKIDTIEAKHQKCREELPEKYAGKSETLKRISNLDEKIDKNRQNLDYMKGVRNGESGK